MSVARLIWEAAGYPTDPAAETAHGWCAICGDELDGKGILAKFPATFVDYGEFKRPDSPWLCQACTFCMGERSEVLQRATGKDRPQKVRNYSHFVVDGQWLPISKGDKVAQYEALRHNPPVAVVAVSGQKHLVLRAQVGMWQVETERVSPDPRGLEEVMGLVTPLYALGFSKDGISTGDYQAWRIMRVGEESWWQWEQQVRAWRGSALLDLAVFLVQKAEGADERVYKAGRSDADVRQVGVGAVAGDGQPVQDALCAGDLEPVRGLAGGRGQDDGQLAGVHQPHLL